MAKVVMPLGSATAHGAIGNIIVFQGEVAREYVIPYDPKTAGQLDVRRLFHDVTKIITRMGLLGKGLLAGYFGPRWYTKGYQRVAENGAARLVAELAIFDEFTSEEKLAWAQASPFPQTYNDPGGMFFGVARVLNHWVDSLTGGDFFDVFPLAGNSSNYRAAYLQGIENVVTLAKTGANDSRLTYWGTWSEESAGEAYLGSYKKTSEPNAMCVFYWRGKRMKIGFVGLENGGSMQVETEGFSVIEIDQNRSSTTYGLSVVKTEPNKGIHKTYLAFFGSPTQAVTLDYLDASN